MEKLRDKDYRLIGFIIAIFIGFMSTNVQAQTMSADEIQGPAYVIGSYVFTRDTNETTGYQGRLTTSLIMLASTSIESSNVDNMIIYYKTAGGTWINGLDGATIEPPASFEINYTNLKLEEVNSTVSVPKAPILDLNGGATSINNENDMLQYMLNIYIDDIDDKANKTDGVELGIVDYNSHVTYQDLKYSDSKFGFVVAVNENYEGDVLEFGKQYHADNIMFENPHNGHYTVSARAYVEDGNGKRTYSDVALVSINADKTLPQLEIVNNYSEPDYIAIDGDYYTYRLGIKQPDAYVYKSRPEKFAYTVNGVDGKFGLDEEFSLTVAKGTVKKCYAQMGYIDKNGDFKLYFTGNEETNRIYFTIDTRTLTAPILSSSSGGENGEYLRINSDFYESAEKDTLDYGVEGTEIYRVYWKENEPIYELIEGRFDFEHVFPPMGVSQYVARVYATNAEGKKVYSDFSEIITVVRTPEIEVSEVTNGQVDVSIVNKNEYGESFEYSIYTWNSTQGEVFIGTIKYSDEKITIDVSEGMSIYAIAQSPSYELGGTIYSDKSNMWTCN